MTGKSLKLKKLMEFKNVTERPRELLSVTEFHMKWPYLCRLIEVTESRMIRNVFFSFTKSNCMMFGAFI